jgi:hypothetical protein
MSAWVSRTCLQATEVALGRVPLGNLKVSIARDIPTGELTVLEWATLTGRLSRQKRLGHALDGSQPVFGGKLFRLGNYLFEGHRFGHQHSLYTRYA